MKIRLLIKGDAIQYGENDFFTPCKTIDIDVADGLIDKEHEHIVGVEIQPKMVVCTYQETGCGSCEYQTNCPY